MAFKNRNRKAAAALAVIFIISAILITCDSPMGFGKAIDFIPPELTLNPVPNPLYVRMGTILTGTVKDNAAVDRVVLTDSATGKELFKAVINGEKWVIELLFSEEQNGEKIMAQISAYDTSNNCGAPSIAFVTMIIDIRPPLVESISIKRTDTREARLESWDALKALETTDPRGERKNNLYRYQNGWFYISGVVNDEETKIERISLDIYDARAINNLLYSIPSVDDGYSFYFPRWTIKEEDIIAAGSALYGEDYKTNYYVNNERYYYRVVIKAVDKSENESAVIQEDQGYLCMWAKSDEPKGVLDPTIGTIVSRGVPLPVDFYDDDSLLWAYTGLLTDEQWYGRGAIYNSNEKMPQKNNDDERVQWLKERLTGIPGTDVGTDPSNFTGTPIYNWKYDKHTTPDLEKIEEQIKGKNLDEHLFYVATGNDENDYGEYVLFSLVADKKLDPHTGAGPEVTNKNSWTGRFWHISVIDENVPLIVFDTNKKDELGNPKPLYSPEENTFPDLIGGDVFNIVGYTLRENKSGSNSVTTFRMAWIPFGMDGGPDKYIPDVQKALTTKTFASIAAVMPPGVEYWDFTLGTDLKDEGNENIDTGIYKRQSFVKKFSVLTSFMYNSKLENKTKLFVFYAVDNMGHEVFRQLRLLAMTTPPNLAIYDISNKLSNELFTGTNPLPDPNLEVNTDPGTGGPTAAYYLDLNNKNANYYSTLRAVSFDDNDKSIPFQIYPRGSVLKYYVNAEKSGDIAIDSISMKDITYSTSNNVFVGYADTVNRDLTFCEYYPDVTQRTFLFEARDRLGNIAQIQRTVAVTNAAVLENITTTEQSGTYGDGKKISLKANFSSQVKWLGANPPELNVRYGPAGLPVNVHLLCITPRDTSTSTLDFEFTVPVNASGRLDSLYDDYSTFPVAERRPLLLPSTGNDNTTTKILDSNRGDSAFIPGYQNESVTMPNWKSIKNSLQEKKNIMLDGVHPRITSVAVGGKNKDTSPITTGNNEFYFKNGETIEFTLSTGTGKDIMVSGAPTLRYQIRNLPNGPLNTVDNVTFKYQRPDGSKGLVFSLPVNNDIFTIEGELVEVGLYTGSGGNIVDNADNTVDASTVGYLISLMPANTHIYIKKNKPNAPDSTNTSTDSTLNGNAFGVNPTTQINFNLHPRLVIGDSKFIWTGWENKKQYSLDGGITWVDYPDVKSGWTSTGSGNLTIDKGTSWDLRVRYVDRAGNEGNERRQMLAVNTDFPKLVSINAVQPNSTYKQGDKLEFTLEFADSVRTTTAANARITLTNRTTIPHNSYSAASGNSFDITLTATAQTAFSTSIKFEWTLNSKEMPNGLYVSNITLAGGLEDRFGNNGVNSTGATLTNINMPNGDCVNLNGAGLIVDCIAPVFIDSTPSAGGVVTSANSKSIVIKFNEPVMAGSGRITVRPYGNYKIPAVLENDGYYLGTNGQRYSSAVSVPAGTAATWVVGFANIYNDINLTADDRNALTLGESMSKLTLDTRTGQSAGPYLRITHGLKEGPGYTGTYLNTNADGPNPDADNIYMVPDTTTKWVLDYRYGLDGNASSNTRYGNTDPTYALTQASSTAVSDIRDVLTKAKWRWQEIDIAVQTEYSDGGKTVTITLNEPLLDGLQWGLTFPEGAFTDNAGNKAAVLGAYNSNGTVDISANSPYWFWSKGVQTPVIRVNRKSFDARTANWNSIPGGTTPNNTSRVYSVPADLGGPGGWGIKDFNEIFYRIDTETPEATIYYGVQEGTIANGGSVTAAWTGTAGTVNGTDRTWQAPNAGATNNGANNPGGVSGEWVLRNLVRRAGSTGGMATSYTVKENGYNIVRNITNDYQGYRSYNRDITRAALTGTAASNDSGASWYQGSFEYVALQASKNYVVAEAKVTNGTTYTSAKGYEGVFRSVVALNQIAWPTNVLINNLERNPIMVQGSNVKNGMPSIAGFPVYDAGEDGDNRFLKLFYYEGFTSGNGNNAVAAPGHLYWVSTEIVSQWYELNACKNNNTNASPTGGGHQTRGDVNNYLYSGYGDLTYAVNHQ